MTIDDALFVPVVDVQRLPATRLSRANPRGFVAALPRARATVDPVDVAEHPNGLVLALPRASEAYRLFNNRPTHQIDRLAQPTACDIAEAGGPASPGSTSCSARARDHLQTPYRSGQHQRTDDVRLRR